MTPLTNLDRVMQLHGRARFIGGLLIPIGVGLGLSALWPVGGVMWWAVFALISGLLHKCWGILSMGVIGGILVSELQEEQSDEPHEEEFTLKIMGKGPVVGTYKDSEIYEWIEFADEKNANKAHYVGTVDDESTTNLPEYSIVMPPGVVYQFDMSQVDKK